MDELMVVNTRKFLVPPDSFVISTSKYHVGPPKLISNGLDIPKSWYPSLYHTGKVQ